jgi:hypothetical protein
LITVIRGAASLPSSIASASASMSEKTREMMAGQSIRSIRP